MPVDPALYTAPTHGFARAPVTAKKGLAGQHLAAVNTPHREEIAKAVVKATGGTFTLTFEGQTTGAIAYNASAATVTTALEALSNIAPGDVVVGAFNGDQANPDPGYIIKFTGVLTDNRTNLTGSGASLTGAGAALTVSTTIDGAVAADDTPLGTALIADIAKPTSVTAVDPAARTGEVDVGFTYPSGITKLDIITRKQSDDTFVKRQEKTGSSPAAVTGLTDGTAYDFYVRGVDADGRVGQSVKVSATPTA